jgi:Leishmanolysin
VGPLGQNVSRRFWPDSIGHAGPLRDSHEDRQCWCVLRPSQFDKAKGQQKQPLRVCHMKSQCRTTSRILWWAVAVTCLVVGRLPSVHGGLICSLLGAPPCFMGLGSIMHQGTPGEPDCRETCAFFFFAILNFFQGYACNGCDGVSGDGGDNGLLIPQENDPNNFGLDVFGVNIPAADAQAFVTAANTWNRVITTDTQGPYTLSRLNAAQPADELLRGCKYPSNGVDDLLICADIRSIDGAGQVLGAAAPGQRDSTTGRPATGFMYFDSADIAGLKAQGTYNTVILHEMGHVLGLGTIWFEKGVQTNSNTCPYVGTFANREYQRLTGCTNSARTEQNGGPGSKCSHWMENSCLGNELMSSALSSNSRLTSITIGSLQDMGYPVDYNQNQDTSLSKNGCCRRRLGLGRKETSPPPPPRRKLLSDELVNTAVAYGQTILATRDDQAKARGVGDDQLYDIVSVLMLENNEIYEVLVNRDGAVS